MKEVVVRLASDIQTDSIVDGEGIRSVIWFQGCTHNCKGCHNPETHDLNGGFEIKLDELLKKISELEYQTGITLSGGDPFFQPYAACEVAKHAHFCNMNVWAYTGFKFEDLLKIMEKNKDIKNLLNNIDVLIDGKFEIDNKTYSAKFRGSSNQRVLDVKESLKNKKAIKYID